MFLTFKLLGFKILNRPLKVAKFVSCILYQLYTKFIGRADILASRQDKVKKKFWIIKFLNKY